MQVPTSHLSHVELRDGKTADASKPKRGEMVRRSTPYALHDGTVGLYFLGLLQDPGAAPRAHGGHLRHERPGARRPHQLLDARVGLVLLRALGRDARRARCAERGRRVRGSRRIGTPSSGSEQLRLPPGHRVTSCGVGSTTRTTHPMTHYWWAPAPARDVNPSNIVSFVETEHGAGHPYMACSRRRQSGSVLVANT